MRPPTRCERKPRARACSSSRETWASPAGAISEQRPPRHHFCCSSIGTRSRHGHSRRSAPRRNHASGAGRHGRPSSSFRVATRSSAAAAACTSWVSAGRDFVVSRCPERPDRPVEVGFASGAAVVVRRTAWDVVGGLDERYFMYGEDLDLALPFRLGGLGVGVHSGSTSRAQLRVRQRGTGSGSCSNAGGCGRSLASIQGLSSSLLPRSWRTRSRSSE
jgi:hypothetical protein